MGLKQRIAVTLLSMSATAFVGLTIREGYTDKAVIPTKGDRPTVGFGSTFRDDGTPVRMGDTITPQQAVKRSMAYIQKSETQIKQCVHVPLTQGEYDTMIDFGYQYGVSALCASSIVANANTGNYLGSCASYRLYRFSSGFDCSTPGNKVCPGVWDRSLDRYKKCMAEQQ